MNWPTMRLDEIAKIDRSGIDPSAIEAGTKYLGLEHIASGGNIIDADCVNAGQLASTKFRFEDSHILYGKLRPYLAKIALPNFSGICSTDILPIRPGPDLDRRFLAYFLRQPHIVELASARSTGVNLPRLSPKALAEFQIPFPSLPEQNRIAVILDKADDIRRKREQILKLADECLRSSFLDRFGHPLDPNGHLERCTLGEHCDFFAGHSLPRGEDFAGQENGLLLVKVSDLKAPGNEVTIRAAKLWTPSKGAARGGVIAPEGSVVFPKRGGAIATNKKRVLGRECVLDPNLMAVAPRAKSHVSNRFIRTWFELIDLASIASGSSVPQLNKKDLEPLAFGVPDRKDVDWFDSIVERVNDMKGRLHTALVEAEAMLGSLSQRAFRGEL